MDTIFKYAPAETVGISSIWLLNFLQRLETQNFPMHSVIVVRHNTICLESYYAPYTRDSLHRMFSITKSFVSIAIGLLEAEGKISLDDKIVDYFPEKQPENGPYEYTAMLTIRQMLKMTTCHNKNTYKAKGVTDWTGSFFTTPPTHIPGTNFAYDTASTHVLGALIEKLSGMSLLEYLNNRVLNELDFSKDTLILKDPSGVSMGGSGLCARPVDILKMIYTISHDGVWNEKQLLPKEYLKAATSRQSDTSAKQCTIEEMQGYGYQFWRTRNNGYVMFGMAGQLALYVPDKDIILVTTADGMGRSGNTQLIYDAFWDEIYNKIDSEHLPENNTAFKELEKYADSRRLPVQPGLAYQETAKLINDNIYICSDNSCGVNQISLHFCDDFKSGRLNFTNKTGIHSIDFKINDNAIGIFDDYRLKYAASGAWTLPDTFVIKAQIIDTAIGNIFFSLNFKDDYITVMFRKLEESLFTEYDGVFSGKCN